MSRKVCIRLDFGSVCCLDGVLMSRLNDVKRHMQAAGHLYTEEERANAERFLSQLRTIRNATDAVIRKAIGAGYDRYREETP